MALLALLLVSLGGCERSAPPPPAGTGEPGVLARGEGWQVDEAFFRHWWATRPGPADSPQARTEALERLTERAVLAAAARQAGVDRDPETAMQIESLLIARLQELELNPRLEAATVSDDEVRARYDSLRDTTYTRPAAVRVAVLWFNSRGQEPLEARYRPRLAQIREAVAAGAEAYPVSGGFGSLSVGNTEHRPSRLKGGVLGWLDESPGQDGWRSAVLELAAPLQSPGEMSEIVASKEGLFLVRLIERRAAEVQPFETVSAAIRRGLLNERRREMREEFRQALLGKAAVQRFPEALAAISELPSREGSRRPTPPDAPRLSPPDVRRLSPPALTSRERPRAP